MKISEQVLQLIWKYRLFKQTELKTQSGKQLAIKKVGHHNTNEGPDFENSLVEMDGINWAGNIEIHIHSSDWDRHKHQDNVAYNSVVLHVVFDYDVEIRRQDGTIPETLVLRPLVAPSTLQRYHKLQSNSYRIPCEGLIRSVEPFYVNQWLGRVLVDRLVSKSSYILQILSETNGDWERTSFIVLARSFGLNLNGDAFEQFARSFPVALVSKYVHRPYSLEALMFGQAGMLEQGSSKDEYFQELKREYGYLKTIHQLKPMSAAAWKFLRMRPHNFPTVRIAQFIALCKVIPQVFTKIIETENVFLWRSLFDTLKVNPFWEEHYHFQKPAKTRHKTALSKSMIDLVIINAIVQILFAYGRYIDDESYTDRALRFLEELPAERNSLVRYYRSLGVEVKSAAETQAIKQLSAIYCNNKRCLDCEIGVQILKYTGVTVPKANV